MNIEEAEKLVPPDGTYAISLMETNTRAMAVISRENKIPELYIISIDSMDELPDKSITTMAFHKKIRETEDINSLNQHINTDIDTINELIF